MKRFDDNEPSRLARVIRNGDPNYTSKIPMGRIYEAGMEDKTAMEKAADKLNKKMSHTPTPWEVTGYAYVLNEPTRGRLASKNGEPIAEEGFELRFTNAAFIVRAVNSHEALLEASSTVTAYKNWSGDTPKERELLVAIRLLAKAIAQAEAQ